VNRRISEYIDHLPYIAGPMDGHGNPTDSWGSAVSVGIYAFDPGSSSEPRDGQDRVIVEPTVYMPDGVVFSPRDRVVVRGKTYEVDGETREWRHPSVSFRGNVASLRRVDG
jgi:hypothetical protein